MNHNKRNEPQRARARACVYVCRKYCVSACIRACVYVRSICSDETIILDLSISCSSSSGTCAITFYLVGKIHSSCVLSVKTIPQTKYCLATATK